MALNSEFDAKAIARQLVNACNDLATQDELDALNALLLNSSEARDFAKRFFKDETLLREELHASMVKSSFHEDLAIPLYKLASQGKLEETEKLSAGRDSSLKNSEPQESGSNAGTSISTSLALKLGKSDGQNPSVMPTRSLLFTATAASAILAMLFIAFNFFPAFHGAPPNIPNTEIEVSQTVSLEKCNSTVRLSDGKVLKPGESIQLGETLTFDNGLAELKFHSGVQLFVKGPAELEITSPMRALLSQGTVTATVEESAHGFRIDTPTSLITDLGTEFGVSVADGGETDVVVFSGEVVLQKQTTPPLAEELESPETSSELPYARAPSRLMLEGEGLRVKEQGDMERLVSIVSSDFPRQFQPQLERATENKVIISVTDNLHTADTIKYYQINHQGFGEDVRAFVDRRYQWNGINAEYGLPQVLRKADYIMPFCDDKFNDQIEIKVELAQAARIFVLIDNRLIIPKWLQEGFEDTGYNVAVDEDPHTARRIWQALGEGPGISLEKSCSVWFKDILTPGTVTFGAVEPPVSWSLMYGIAAVPLSVARSTPQEPIAHHSPKIGSGLIREEFLPKPKALTDLQWGQLYTQIPLKVIKEDAAGFTKGMRFIPETLGGKLVPYKTTRMLDGGMLAMNDGLAAQYNRHFYRYAWYNGQARFSLDLKRSVEIDSINCFSRHDGVRSWQFYTVWGSDSSKKPAVDFDRPGQAKDWDFIGLVDSRDQTYGGIHASSLHAAEGPIGTYRHLLWICEDLRYSTCFTEIDVHEAK